MEESWRVKKSKRYQSVLKETLNVDWNDINYKKDPSSRWDLNFIRPRKLCLIIILIFALEGKLMHMHASIIFSLLPCTHKVWEDTWHEVATILDKTVETTVTQIYTCETFALLLPTFSRPFPLNVALWVNTNTKIMWVNPRDISLTRSFYYYFSTSSTWFVSKDIFQKRNGDIDKGGWKKVCRFRIAVWWERLWDIFVSTGFVHNCNVLT